MTSRRCRRDGGFTLVELVVSIALLGLALAISAQLLRETQQMVLDAGREVLDPDATLVAGRLRADILGAQVAIVVERPDLSCKYLELVGHPPGPIFYQLSGATLWRSVFTADGRPLGASPLLRGATSFSCIVASGLPGKTVVLVDYRYRRSSTRRSPLPLAPSTLGPRQEVAGESLILMPRGSGLGTGW